MIINCQKIFFDKYLIIEKKVIIDPGTSLNEITNLLFNNNIINNKLFFQLWVRLNSLEQSIKYGEYQFVDEMSIDSLTTKLVNGQTVSRLLTIPEGMSRYHFVKLINSNKLENQISEKDLPKLLIANTYFYKFHDSPDEIIKIIEKKSIEQINDILDRNQKNLITTDINKAYILASIIEKETGKISEMNKIAGVFLNRLESNMRLQSDPTVIYSLTKGKKFPRKLSRKDLKIDSKFNTYRISGIPPEAISIPRIEAFEAVINPYRSNFYYFVADKKGGHFFSETYSEHLEKIKDLRKKNIND